VNRPLVALDTPTLYYRSFHALPDTITNASGMPVNAVRGVLDTVATLVTAVGSPRIVAAMDADWRPAFRTAVAPEYKAQRIKDEQAGTEMPESLAVQLPLLNELLAAAGIPVAAVPGTEADDVIASITAQVPDSVVVVSSDRDLLSLLGPDRDVAIMRPRKAGAWETVRLPELRELYGVADGPQYRQLAALRGDPADGLSGAPGIGEKTAAKLLAGYGSIADLYAAVLAGAKDHGLSEKRRSALLDARTSVERNHAVMTCLEDLDVAEFVSAAGSPADAARVTALAAENSVERSAAHLLSALDAAR
jgi:5'-3' exonuclease